MKEHSFFIESLGCAKNSVDSSSMVEILAEQGFQQVQEPSRAKFIIVNTCGFIQIARDESVTVLQKLGKNKKPDQKIIAAGCMLDYHRELLLNAVPQIDGFISTRNWKEIIKVIQEIKDDIHFSHNQKRTVSAGIQTAKDIHRVSIQGGSAYLKIADGCRRGCAFCSIPMIKGPNKSRTPEQIIRDAHFLANSGVKEVILIAQDTTDYGSDLRLKDGLANLLLQLTNTFPDIPWIRILYAFPGAVSDRLIDVLASRSQLLHYFDIPLQHANIDILKKMKRPCDLGWIQKTIEKMRKSMPDLSIRTTFIVGYPGETEEIFVELLQFLEEIQFDHVGAFIYSQETGTPAFPLGDPIPSAVKEDRLNRLLKKQAGISLKNNQKFIGKTMQMLVEGQDSGISIGRSYRDAPEIDGLLIAEGVAQVGEIVPVLISGALDHDLTAVIKIN
jgi:ribosomal protein S12 methylthiotransferase